MRQELSIILIKKRPELVDAMDPDNGLMSELLARSILTKRQTKSIEVLRDPYKQNEAILDALHKRPDKDFEEFRQALLKTDQVEAAELLQTSSDKKAFIEADLKLSHPVAEIEQDFKYISMQRDGSYDVMRYDVMSGSKEQWGTNTQPGTQETGPPDPLAGRFGPLHHQSGLIGSADGRVITPRQFYELRKHESYPMSKIHRGKCFIFYVPSVLSDNKRFEKSEQSLRSLFLYLHFSVETLRCPSAQIVKDKIARLSMDPSLHDDQCLVIFCIGGMRLHGNRTEQGYRNIDCLYGKDRVPVQPREILRLLAECVALRGKPKLMFMQSLDGGVTESDAAIPSTHSHFSQSSASVSTQAGFTESDAVPSTHHWAQCQPIPSEINNQVTPNPLPPNQTLPDETLTNLMLSNQALSNDKPLSQTSANQNIACASRREGAEGSTAYPALSLRDFIIGFSLHQEYLDTIIRVFIESAHDTDVSAMMRQVNGIISEAFSEPGRKIEEKGDKARPMIRRPSIISLDDTLSKSYLYFFPGIVEH